MLDAFDRAFSLNPSSPRRKKILKKREENIGKELKLKQKVRKKIYKQRVPPLCAFHPLSTCTLLTLFIFIDGQASEPNRPIF